MVCDKDYLPVDFMEDKGADFASGYCIYAISSSDMYVDYDSTRDENVEVTDAHTEQIHDSYFVVYTALDDKNKEIITECCFYYHEALGEEVAESTEYFDINGMEYRDLKLNEDRTKAIVVYYNEGEEKEFVVELPEKLKE